MKDAKAQVENFKKKLADVKLELQALQVEKEELLKAYNNANEKEKQAIIKEMKASEQRFKDLCDRAEELARQVHKFNQTI